MVVGAVNEQNDPVAFDKQHDITMTDAASSQRAVSWARVLNSSLLCTQSRVRMGNRTLPSNMPETSALMPSTVCQVTLYWATPSDPAAFLRKNMLILL